MVVRCLTPEIDLYAPAVTKPLSLRVLIACIEDRVAVMETVGERSLIGCSAELLEQALPHLRKLHQLEASRA